MSATYLESLYLFVKSVCYVEYVGSMAALFIVKLHVNECAHANVNVSVHRIEITEVE